MKTMTITIDRKPQTITFDGQEMQVEELSIRLPFGRKPADITDIAATLDLAAPVAGSAVRLAVPLLFAVVAFDLPVAGSLWAITVVATVGGMAFSGIGLLIAARPRTFEAVSGVLNLVMLPMWVLGGIFFATSNFPAALQPWIQAIPLAALNDALRAVILLNLKVPVSPELGQRDPPAVRRAHRRA